MRKAVVCFCVALFLMAALPAQAGDLSDRLLVSSAWCTFSYNNITGYSNSTRYVFSPDGIYRKGGRAEGYSSGSGGSMASQQNSQALGRWRVMNGELYLSEGNGQLAPVRTVLKRNGNGFVVVANGVEYAQCR